MRVSSGTNIILTLKLKTVKEDLKHDIENNERSFKKFELLKNQAKKSSAPFRIMISQLALAASSTFSG